MIGRLCESCRVIFQAQRVSARYCSQPCRQSAYEARKSDAKPAPTQDIEAASSVQVSADQQGSNLTLTGTCPAPRITGFLARAHKRAVAEGRQGCSCKRARLSGSA